MHERLKRPRITVCIATFMGENYILDQVHSILHQLNDDDEILIQDDCSTDATVAKLLRLNDSRIKIEVNEKNIGYIANFERVLMRANSDIVFLSDQDDIWHVNKVAISLERLLDHEVVISNAAVFNNCGTSSESYFSKRFLCSNGIMKRMIAIMKPRYLGCCIALKGDVLKQMLPFAMELKRVPHDYIIGTYSSLFLKLHFIEQPLVFYRRHEENVSNGGERSTLSGFQKFSYRLRTLLFCIKRKIKLSNDAR